MSSHGLSGSSVYSVWCNMKATCKRYDVPLHEEWKGFMPFYHWAINCGYEEGLYLDRIDKSVGYIPSNHEFISKDTRKEHGQYNTRLYKIWAGIKQRCHNPDDTAYKFYGEKNIKVCKEWFSSFESFY